MKLFLDTNVLIDAFNQERKQHISAFRLIHLLKKAKYEAFVSSHSLTDMFYILRKTHSVLLRVKILNFILQHCTIIYEDRDMFLTAIANPELKDLEDEMQQIAAQKAGVDFIVTTNLKDFEKSEIAAISISNALSKIQS
ncbi:MAG: PIN domain-containing protein [Cardiobacteriaceae bacterium]|nr:PIN domain-containing protein [Cardiobacteriaceae bacterium]